MTNGLQPPAAITSDGLPRHSRPQPPEWTALHEMAAGALAASPLPGLIPFGDLKSLVNQVKNLDNETLERNRYYALGVVTCRFAQALAAPQQRAAVVEKAGAILASQVERGSKNLRLNDLLYSRLDPATNDLLPIVDASLEPADRVVADSLCGVSNQRFYRMQHRYLRSWQTGKYLAQRRSRAAAIQVAGSSLSGAAAVAWRALQIKAAHDGLLAAAENPPLSAIASRAELDALDLAKAGRTIAGLHKDELDVSELTGLLVDDGTGKVAVRRPAHGFPAAPAVKPVTSLHAERLTCPALQVAGAIPQVLGLFPDIITAAEQRVQAR